MEEVDQNKATCCRCECLYTTQSARDRESNRSGRCFADTLTITCLAAAGRLLPGVRRVTEGLRCAAPSRVSELVWLAVVVRGHIARAHFACGMRQAAEAVPATGR